MGDSPPPKKTKHGPGYIPEPYWRGTEEWSSDHTVSLAINNKLPITYALKLTGNPCSYQALKKRIDHHYEKYGAKQPPITYTSKQADATSIMSDITGSTRTESTTLATPASNNPPKSGISVGSSDAANQALDSLLKWCDGKRIGDGETQQMHKHGGEPCKLHEEVCEAVYTKKI
mmetsp:Transcript_167/g.438  ORF Transcript_167/g.438 Transcript_167/m.438 type:complete len:174 (-) Transcript_167:478-999(-)